MGKLMIDGTVDLSQFWPTGESDADTTKIALTVAPGAVQYQPDNDGPRPTTQFDRACVKSFGQLKPVIKDGRITVRLQGVDAPELHYQPQSMKGKTYKGRPFGSLKGSGLVKKYRQRQAETATVRLGRYLSTFGSSPLPCRFQTAVTDHEGPADAVDKYGRFVGNVLINEVDLNLEILRQGLAIVALYNSMTPAEMEACLEAWAIGKTATEGVVQYQTRTIGEFDPQLLFQSPAHPTLKPEKTVKFIHPKLYRRQCTWWAYRKLGTFKSGFDTYLSLFPDDIFFERSSMRDEGFLAATPFQIEQMVKAGRKVIYAPDEVVFKEAGSQLFTGDGQLIREW
ncbi:MAG TPA: thermonuclease family protein [Nitrospira sp.]|nr:thermonuclease family protein [Nitrospira sp.]